MLSSVRFVARSLSISAALVSLAYGSSAHAADPWAPSPYRSKDYPARRELGLSLALRGGVDFPFTDWDTAFHLNVPVRFDVGLHLDDHFGFGAYVRYEKWLGGVSGVQQDFAFGLNTQWRAKSGMTFDPWGGYGAGIRKFDYGAFTTTSIEFADVQFGGDYEVSKSFFFGPYLEGAFGYDLDLTTINAAATAGLRVSLDL